MHRAGQLAQGLQGDLFPSGVGIVIITEWLYQVRQTHDLYPVEGTKPLVPVVNGQTYMGVLLETDELLAALTEHPEAASMPAVLDGGTAYIVSGPGGQGTGIVGQDVFLCHGLQFVLLQLDAGGVLFLPVAGGSLIFLICHANPS